ncbi:MAG: Peptidyl-tRNA hydrolase [Candidatus Wolfebacteria bacterium GW2011_GWC2_46_275]|nr:MAG: Peptidyl-tRNA hydrolase [Candidatus Wolfebacteria bacterium GW2011_GWC2_46_275]KKU41725.1 MAG: Peptidyl-tRNA hydrolase [Candidatus Wolfebacteria bacterium GW2011_GWB2_46_69]KKU53981.1 MAG: Peptidyl-tRNA hydrolase [Candidatus Wolfebacteria bacterium GW2011_GWC1_47_103]KKU72077.1 MAG: Peptidyl-tRNA hydrolase [Candidatus Wolfebacteria bacterium GW2011_GWB1_47_243]
MNVSGPAVARFLKKDGIKPDHFILVHDDVDIPLGEYKFSFGSGAAGHHGVESVINSLGTKDFWRLRIGIAKHITTPDGTIIKKKADTYVLKPISQKDLEQMQIVFEEAAKQLQE